MRPPDASDGDIDESSSVADIIDYGCQALEMGGRGSRVEWLWRRRGLKALHHLRLKKLASKEFADAAESFGIESRSEAFKLAHIWSRIGDVDSWAAAKVNESLRRRGIEKWPSNNAILAEFPSPNKKSPLSQEERDEKKAEQDAARARAKAKRNSVGGDEELAPALDALRALLEKARRDLEFERAGREATERTLAREQEIADALHEQLAKALQEPKVPPTGVSAQELLRR